MAVLLRASGLWSCFRRCIHPTPKAHFDLHQISVFMKNQVPPASENPPPSPGSCHGNHPGQFAALTQLPLSTDEPRRTESDIWNGAAVDFLPSTVGSVVQPRAAEEAASLRHGNSLLQQEDRNVYFHPNMHGLHMLQQSLLIRFKCSCSFKC